ncbi:two-component sensor histidine kinase [Lysobacter bugurensis]|uniref:histidine kinase n=2 Tax=Cognatilysobacter bugurensis TaxID=543356 RepID=A0A918SXI7_9GAMM|nr:two-component sensor histidine kinase [Lysobacter bugurensis]
MDDILHEWDTFARQVAPEGSGMSDVALRDHAREMLEGIVQEMAHAHPRSADERRLRSREGGDAFEAGSAAAQHGDQRQSADFTLLQLSAEFRVLRETVMRLWLPTIERLDAGCADEIVRFNEALDRALAESIVAYSDRTNQTRELFLAVLGHDLRAPLATLALSGALLARPDLPDGRQGVIAGNVTRATQLMQRIVNDLLGFTRTQLGKGLPIERGRTSLQQVIKDALEDARAAYPNTRFECDIDAALVGDYDGTRLYQLFVNLLVNAAQHGAADTPVRIEAHRVGERHVVHVTNEGVPIPDAALHSIFKPLVQLDSEGDGDDGRPRTSLGLGLFISREIAEGHDGTIAVRSNPAQGTRFTVDLPCSADAAHSGDQAGHAAATVSPAAT